MGKARKHSSEQIMNLLRQIEVAVANGKTTLLACRESGLRIRPTAAGGRSMAGCRQIRCDA